jgi:cell division protein FtsB
MTAPHASCITNVNNIHSNEQILALLQQLVAQNAELLQQVAELQAKTDLLEHKIDSIAEEAGLI